MVRGGTLLTPGSTPLHGTLPLFGALSHGRHAARFSVRYLTTARLGYPIQSALSARSRLPELSRCTARCFRYGSLHTSGALVDSRTPSTSRRAAHHRSAEKRRHAILARDADSCTARAVRSRSTSGVAARYIPAEQLDRLGALETYGAMLLCGAIGVRDSYFDHSAR
jgi:hypothetical protein